MLSIRDSFVTVRNRGSCKVCLATCGGVGVSVDSGIEYCDGTKHRHTAETRLMSAIGTASDASSAAKHRGRGWPGSPGVGGMRKGRGLDSRRWISGGWAGWTFIAPAVLVFALFVIAPLGEAVTLAFTSWSGYGRARFIGLANFREALLHDPGLWHSLDVTGVYAAVAVALCFGLAFLLALGLYKRPPGWRVFRTAIFVPVVSPGVAMALFWQLALAPRPLGFLDTALGTVGLGALERDWLASPHLALLSIILVSVWGEVGVPTILILAGLLRLPSELNDAAAVDGASAVQRTAYITAPLLRPVFAVTTLVLALWAIQVFTVSLVLTGGGPGTATYVTGLFIFTTAFKEGRFGYANAISMLIAVIMGLIALAGVRMIMGSTDRRNITTGGRGR